MIQSQQFSALQHLLNRGECRRAKRSRGEEELFKGELQLMALDPYEVYCGNASRAALQALRSCVCLNQFFLFCSINS